MSNEMIETKDIWRSLKCTFTEKEKIVIAEAMANAVRERTRLDSELTSIKKQYSSDISKQESEITSLAERLNTGWEMRRVECNEIRDFNNGTVRVYRNPPVSDEPQGYTVAGWEKLFFVEERAMTAEERQMGLFEPKTDGTPISGDGMGGEITTTEPSPLFIENPETGEKVEVLAVGQDEILPSLTCALPQEATIPPQSIQGDALEPKTRQNELSEDTDQLIEESEKRIEKAGKFRSPDEFPWKRDAHGNPIQKKRGRKPKEIVLPE